MTLSSLAVWITLVIVGQIILGMGWLFWRYRRLPLKACVPAVKPFPEGMWSGTRSFRVERKVYENQTQSACSFYLKPLDARPLPPYLPGQYLTFVLPQLSPKGEPPVIRCYSLSDAPSPEYYRVTIKKVPARVPEQPSGLASTYFHEHVQEGTVLEVKAPQGQFVLNLDSPRPLVFLGSGIGITPILSMLRLLWMKGFQQTFWCFYGCQNSQELMMPEFWKSFELLFPQGHLYVCYSRPLPSDRLGQDYQHLGHLNLELLQQILPSPDVDFYLCGPGAMMQSLVPALEGWGGKPMQIHYEAFGPSTIQRPSQAGKPTSPLQVTFARSKVSYLWKQEFPSLLEFAEAHGVRLNSGCRAGSCGACAVKIVKGEVEYGRLPDVEEGFCLPCQAVPRTELVLWA